MYPPEYLLHPVPVLAVYGISLEDENKPVGDVLPSSGIAGQNLGSSILKFLTNKTEYNIYEATRYSASNQSSPPFQVITVSKDYILPQKPQSSVPSLPPPHSNISPLSKESPLYPDGIITPLWIKKQMNLPSVVIGFYELWDWSSEAGNEHKPQRETGPLASQVLIDPTEREHDSVLSAEINTKRKYFQEKGVKFAVVFMLKQKNTDASIEERLSLIKKQCGLDSKSTFFTAAPGSSSDIQDFVNSLSFAILDSSLYYYSNKLKKIRKKKSKLPSISAMPRPSSDVLLSEPQPLSIMGWNVRYDIKAAFVQEMKQELDGALKSYETAYGVLVEMLTPSSTGAGNNHLVIHSERWKDARILADCTNIKICKLHLYMNDPTAALAQLNSHLHMFQSYSSNWGMGEHTFEYWTWLSKQYRIFADTIAEAIKSGYKVPSPTEYLYSGANVTPGSPLLNSINSTGTINSNSGCNPGAILQHPGFYYHLAAMCCAERRRRYLDADRLSSTNSLNNDHVAALLEAEKQVDHSNLTVELLTKSYEQFKRYRNGRMTLYLAAEIAGTYYETGKFEMALKFFERIGKTYRKEKWHMILTSILRWSLRCAKELGPSERAVEYLVELLSDELPMADNKRSDIQKELFDTLNNQRSPQVEKPLPLVINMDQINSFITCQVQIKNRTNFVGAPVEYQIFLTTNKASPPVPFRFGTVKVVFSDPKNNVILKDNGIDNETKALELINFSENICEITEEGEYNGWNTADVDLKVFKSQTKVLQGHFIPRECGELKFVSVSLNIVTPHWQVELNYEIDKFIEELPSSRRKWLHSTSEGKLEYGVLDGRGYLSLTNVMQKPPCIDLKFDHTTPALLDELFKLNFCINSTETRAIDATIHVDMKYSEGVANNDYVTFSESHEDEELSTTKELNIGTIEPGESVDQVIYLHGGDSAGTRLISVTVKYTISGNDSSQKVEKSESIRIPFIIPFDVNFELCAQNNKLKNTVSPDLEKIERWLIVSAIQSLSTSDLEIKTIRLNQDKSFKDPYMTLSLISKMDDLNDRIWKMGDIYNVNYLFELSTIDITENQVAVPVGSLLIEWKRATTKEDIYYKSVVKLPSIEFQQQGLVVLADIPFDIHLGEPFTLSYTIYNPTKYLADFNASVELSEAFVFSGYKQFRGRVLPLSKAVYKYTCYPLLAGKVKLPRLKVMASQQQNGEKEVPVEVFGGGITLVLNSELQPKQLGSPSDANTPQPIVAFVNAKRTL